MLQDYQVASRPVLDSRQPDLQIPSLSQIWARKYIRDLSRRDQDRQGLQSALSRAETAQHLRHLLRTSSAQAWSQTEALLAGQVERHDIQADWVDPWAISKDVHRIYERALTAYAESTTPQRFSVKVSRELGEIRQRHTAVDARVIGFVSMQFHYCGQLLIQQAPPSERGILQDYFKVVDDLLYMPLHRAYMAAAMYDYHHPRLAVIRTALPVTHRIATTIVDRVHQLCPDYQSYSGSLTGEMVRIASIRDVEMFQIYLWTCVLEQNIAPITQELFPLCVMLYPTLKVSWGLVRLMVNLLDQELEVCLGSLQTKHYDPYYQELLAMFSPEVFQDMD